ncbi:MAG: nucleotidyltransferase [Cyanobacteria bacterium RI_101]|nr:nucleotidyltransferase [Cyanobacteria bacterium RI_101]
MGAVIPPRWHYRFDNYRRALLLLREAMALERPLTPLEKEGAIQRFEYTMELAWKTLKDYLEAEGVVLAQVTPRAVLRRGFEANILARGEIWQQALDARNKMSHTYNIEDFEQVIADIRLHYLDALGELYDFLSAQKLKEPLN